MELDKAALKKLKEHYSNGVKRIPTSPASEEGLRHLGMLRLPDVLRLIPVSKSTWWAGVRTGRFPSPIPGLGGRIAAWRASDIRALIDRNE